MAMEASCRAVTQVVVATSVAIVATRGGVKVNNVTKDIYQYSSCGGYSANGG